MKLKKIYKLIVNKKYFWDVIYSIYTLIFYKPFMINCGFNSKIIKPITFDKKNISLGSNCKIMHGSRFEVINAQPTTVSSIIEIGNNVVFQQYCHITAASKIKIGSGTLISFNVSIQDTDHCYTNIKQSIAEQNLLINQTIIGNNCFIGARVSILAGTLLGNHCIVGANSVLRGQYPDYCVLVGIPARVVKRYDVERTEWRKTDRFGNFLED